MHLAPALCILLLITAWYAPVLADEPSDIDALILAGLENQTVTDEIERVLQDEDALLSFEPACCLAEEQMAGVSHSTYERIRQTYATDERVNNLMEQHVKRDSVVDLTFKGMPFESETWLVSLIVTIVITVVILVAYYVAPHIPAWWSQLRAWYAKIQTYLITPPLSRLLSMLSTSSVGDAAAVDAAAVDAAAVDAAAALSSLSTTV